MTVHVICTGGTITSHWDGATWTNVSGAQLVEELGDLPVPVVVDDVAAGPSSQLSVDDMVAVAGHVRRALDHGATGVVVVHGTDTLELTAFVVQLLLGTSPDRAPVVVTGSMRVHSHPMPDGPSNLRDALAVAASPAARGREVLVCLDGVLHTADRVRKQQAVSVGAFDSAPFAPVGHVVDGHAVFDLPAEMRRAATHLVGPVPLVVAHPGIESSAVPSGCPGLVVAGFGDLNVPDALWAPMLAAADAGGLVVVASQVFTPNRGDDALRALGVIGAGGLSPQKARLALMAALGSTTSRGDAIAFMDDHALTGDAGDRGTTS